MKRFYLKAAIVLLSIFLTFSYASAKENLLFVVGEWAPFVSKTLDQNGVTAKIVEAACKKAGFDATFTFTDWDQAYKMIKTGLAVGSFPWKKTEQRLKEVVFPETPIMVSKEYVYYLKSKMPSGIQADKMEMLKPYDMVGLASYWYEDAAQKAGVRMLMVKNAQMAWMMIRFGQKEAFIENELVAKHDMQAFYPNEVDLFGHSPTPISQSDMFLIFSQDNPVSIKAMPKINAALKEMKSSGEIDKILGN